MSEIDVPWLAAVALGLSCLSLGWNARGLFDMPRSKKEKK